MSDKGSTIPPGQADFAYFLSQLPQVSEYDCGVELDQLTMSGVNRIALETGKTVNEVARDAMYAYLRAYFQQLGDVS